MLQKKVSLQSFQMISKQLLPFRAPRCRTAADTGAHGTRLITLTFLDFQPAVLARFDGLTYLLYRHKVTKKHAFGRGWQEVSRYLFCACDKRPRRGPPRRQDSSHTSWRCGRRLGSQREWVTLAGIRYARARCPGWVRLQITRKVSRGQSDRAPRAFQRARIHPAR